MQFSIESNDFSRDVSLSVEIGQKRDYEEHILSSNKIRKRTKWALNNGIKSQWNTNKEINGCPHKNEWMTRDPYNSLNESQYQ